MRKLVRGIVEFRRNRRPDYAETFSRLALRQKPDALYIACSDSRVQANVFASTEPGLAGWWFEIATAEVHAWDPGLGRFRPIDDDHAAQILRRIECVRSLPNG